MAHTKTTNTPWENKTNDPGLLQKVEERLAGTFNYTVLCHWIITNSLRWWRHWAGRETPDYPRCFARTIDRIDTPVVLSKISH